MLTTGGYLRQVARLPDFMGGAGASGAVARVRVGVRRLGPATFDTNVERRLPHGHAAGPRVRRRKRGIDGASRIYLGIGRIFR